MLLLIMPHLRQGERSEVRNKIKHGNEEESKMYETVWEKVNEYIEENE